MLHSIKEILNPLSNHSDSDKSCVRKRTIDVTIAIHESLERYTSNLDLVRNIWLILQSLQRIHFIVNLLCVSNHMIVPLIKWFDNVCMKIPARQVADWINPADSTPPTVVE